MNNNKFLDFAKKCEANFSVETLKEVLNWCKLGTYEDYKPLFEASGVYIGSKTALYCTARFGKAVFSLKVNKAGLITEVVYFCDYKETEEALKAFTALPYLKYNFKF